MFFKNILLKVLYARLITKVHINNKNIKVTVVLM